MCVFLSSTTSPTRRTSGGGRFLVDAAQHRANPRDQFRHAEGLGHVIVRAQFQADDFIGFLDSGGQHDHRRAALFAKVAHEFEAVHLRHHDVQQHQIGLLVAGDKQRLAPVVGGDGAKAIFAEIIGDHALHTDFVIDDQDRFHGCISFA